MICLCRKAYFAIGCSGFMVGVAPAYVLDRTAPAIENLLEQYHTKLGTQVPQCRMNL